MSKTHILIGDRVRMDISILLKTRLLIQANSGGGKSWLLRRLAEQLFGLVPVLIIDPEGEFATLREKFGYVLVGKGGETPADPRSAKLVAHKLLELRASAVCDIYEMNPSARHHWVRLFLEGLVDAPKELWHPTIVIVDEAHTFCPEKGQGESEAAEAMTALSTRGRKRRFCAIWATQRLAKLSKSATAEMLNRLIGPTFEDVDLKRAADLLSVAKENRREFEKEMRVLEPGNFYALGRAIATERVLVRVGDVQTSHEIEDAKQGLGPPPTPDKIKSLLPKLADLPKEAEEKLRTEADLRSDLNKRQLGVRAGLSSTSGTFGTYLTKLRTNGWIEGSDSFHLTQAGIDALGNYHPLPEGQALLDYWLNNLGGSGASRMLRCLADVYPQPMTKEALGEAAQISSSSGTFGTYLTKLRTLELIEGRSELTATKEFFES